MLTKPSLKPKNPNFSSGPCNKHPDYNVANLDLSLLGRSHRSKEGKAALQACCERTAQLLGLPEGYRVGVVPASDTGAFEMAMWNLLGQRPVDVFGWESFGRGWVTDIVNQLKLDKVNTYLADYGQLPDLTVANPDHDIVFTWNGTTSGVKVPNGDWIADDRSGLTLCDATSAVFAMDIPWQKIDVLTFSWQKALGGEGAHGMLVLSPRAIERLESYNPGRPLPKIFRLTNKGKLIEGIFQGDTINTPSMLTVADYLDALDWVERMGGTPSLIAASEQNFAAIAQFVAENDWIEFLAKTPDCRSNTSVCLTLKATPERIKKMTALLAEEQVAFDINGYKDAPAGIRIWAGATVELMNIERLLPWLAWAYHVTETLDDIAL